jgi:ankyrin repeat protein
LHIDIATKLTVCFTFSGNTALHWAFQHGLTDLAYVLAQHHGANTSILNNYYCPPIHLAFQAGHCYMLELLLPLPCLAFVRHSSELHDLSRSDGAARNETKLGEVVGLEETFSANHLMAAKAAEQMFNKYRKKEEEAIQQLNCLETFLKNYVHYDPNKKGKKEYEKREKEIFKFVYHLKPHRNFKEPEFCLLHYFVAINHVPVIQKLLSEDYSYPPDMVSKAGYSPLMVGLNRGCLDAVLLLLVHKVNVTMLDPITKMTTLQLLLKDLRVQENHRLIVDKLLEKGNIVFFTFRSGQ